MKLYCIMLFEYKFQVKVSIQVEKNNERRQCRAVHEVVDLVTGHDETIEIEENDYYIF